MYISLSVNYFCIGSWKVSKPGTLYSRIGAIIPSLPLRESISEWCWKNYYTSLKNSILDLNNSSELCGAIRKEPLQRKEIILLKSYSSTAKRSPSWPLPLRSTNCSYSAIASLEEEQESNLARQLVWKRSLTCWTGKIEKRIVDTVIVSAISVGF